MKHKTLGYVLLWDFFPQTLEPDGAVYSGMNGTITMFPTRGAVKKAIRRWHELNADAFDQDDSKYEIIRVLDSK